MDSKAPATAGRPRQVERPRLGIVCGEPRPEQPDQWHLHPRSRPKEDGSRRITIDARSARTAFVVDLSAGEAAELMLELGFALEQAARDEKSLGPPRAQATPGGRA